MSDESPKVFVWVLLSLRTAVHDFCSNLSRSGVPLDLIVQTSKHLKRQMSLGNQLEPVPLYDITSIKCCIQRET